MKENGYVNAAGISTCHHMNISVWQLKYSSYKILAGNPEEGTNHASDHSTHLSLKLPWKNAGGAPMNITEQ